MAAAVREPRSLAFTNTKGNQYHPRCHARFVDLDRATTPPDLPPAMAGLKLIRGGKA